MAREPTIAELTAELAYRCLSDFVRQGWPVLHPSTPLVWGWHMDVVCAELERQVAGVEQDNPATGTPIPWAQDVVINVPPGTSKSMLTSVFLPAWMWLRRPSWRAIYASANPTVALRDALFCRQVLDSDWYGGLKRELRVTWELADDQNAKGFYLNDQNGFRMALSIGAKITGARVDALFVDDPHDAAEADSEVARAAVIKWWDVAFANRLGNLETGTRTVIMQRLHEDDLSGHMLRAGGVRHVVLPMEHDPALPFAYEGDPRGADPTMPRVLHPARFPPAVLAKERTRLREAGYAGQMQQNPVPATGNRFQRTWWRWWRPDGVPGLERPRGCATQEQSPSAVLGPKFRFDEITISVDANFKDKKDADRTCSVVVGRKGPDRYLLARYLEPSGFGKALAAIRAQRDAFPRAARILIEDKANGSAIIETLKKELTGVVEIQPEGGKEARASVMEPVVEGGNWWLPEHMPWTDEWVHEFAVFPLGSHDDQVDAASQLECYWTVDDALGYARRMAGVKG